MSDRADPGRHGRRADRGGGRGGDDARRGHRGAAQRAGRRAGDDCGSGPPAPGRSARCAHRGRRCRRESPALESLPREPTTRGSSWSTTGIEVGLLEARDAVGERAAGDATGHLPTCWHPFSPRWSSPRTSPARSRPSPARSRSSAASPASSSTACRSASTWSTATTGSRSGTASARPAPRACGATRWWDGRCSTCSPASRPAQLEAEFDRVFAHRRDPADRAGGRPSGTRRATSGMSKIPMRLDGDAITHVITIGEDVTELARGAAADPAEREARRDRPARRRRHARDQQPARHHRRLRRGDRGRAWRTDRRPRPSGEYLDIIDREVERCTRIVDGLLDFSRPEGGSARRRVPVNARWWTRPCSCSSTTSASSGSRWSGELAPGPAAQPWANGEQLIQALMALHAERGRRDGAGRHAHRPHRRESGARDDEVMVEFADTGVGHSAEATRARSSSRSTPPSRRAGAPGSASRSATGSSRSHRGRIEVDSTAGPGHHLPGLPAGRGRMKILVVEDDRTVGQYVQARARGAALPGRPGGRRDRGAPPGLGRAVRPHRARPPAARA